MTITLQWWMWPLAILLGSWLFAWLFSDKPSGGMLDANISGFLWVVAGFVAACGIVMGHFV